MDTIAKTLDVDPTRGVDEPSGRPHLPHKTLTVALGATQGNTLIKLAPGTYSAATGERFPITVPDGVMIAGQEATQGQGIVIAGGGAGPGGSSVGLVMQGQSQLRGVTVQNPQGVGILINSGAPLVRACRLSQCVVGLQVASTARPLVTKTRVEDCGDRGLSFTDQARGEAQDCTVERCGTGIYIGQTAAPLMRGCQCSSNQIGVQIAGSASPVLRQTRLGQNQTGLVVQDTGRPDLGQPDDPAGNSLRYNRQADLRNDTRQSLLLVGNDVVPQGLVGAVTLGASQQPDPAAVPPPLLSRPASGEAPDAIAPGETPAPPIAVAPTPPPAPATPSRFRDLGNHWATAYIEALADRNLVKGYPDNTYRPEDPINRAQFAALVAASYSLAPVRASVTFVDVPPTHWASRAIDQAQRQGFLGGFPDQTFRPEQGMVRVQAMVAVATGLKLPPAPASGLGVYRDRAQIPSYAIDALASATQAGVVINHPDPGLLRPLETMTRAEVAVLIYQGLVAQEKAPRLNIGVTPPPTTMSRGSFPDIQTHWALDFIQGLLNLGLVQGDDAGRFNPAQPMTRAQFAALVNRAFAPAPRRPAQLFRDVPSGYWGASAIQTAYRGGFLSGFPDQTFGPENPLLRAQVWVALISGLALLPNQPGNLSLLGYYRDRDQIPDYAVNAIAKATQLNLVVNVPDIAQLHPNRVASRADVCAAVYQALVLQLRAARLDNPFIVRP
ncbi:S-layer homology domain-containing protein [Nodosilinea sp. LEGE 06152]|uniref:S-layer homology domain-containing protein n=1 Tax=Nodosilinea sp. LEGE 06152 TaxID=2777966 RepID=UPI00188185A0|nr:S-layer homology domain-containing protein [Nodosilinea sp. LEGE 06152]MBE9158026.1 S-layer homology domain-containing protein [Nodosilinea sp. LEGE 06152]